METASKLILAFVTIIVGLMLLGQIATSTNGITSESQAALESHALTVAADSVSINTTAVNTVTYPPTGWETTDCPLTSFSITNASGTALTLTTDYTVTLSQGTYILKNTTNTVKLLSSPGNNSYANYKYCGDNYMNSQWGRGVLTLVPGFFAIALMIVGVALFYSVYQDFSGKR
jgi:hypothetical protein